MRVSFSTQLPSSLYSLGYHSSHYNKDTNQLIVIWRVTQHDGFGMMVITTGQAEQEIPVIGNPTIKNYLLGKSWGWGEEDGVSFINEEQIVEITTGFTQV